MPAIPLSLPPLPAAQAQAVTLLSDPDAEPSDLAEAVALDPSLTSAVLRGANSAASAPITPVTSVDVGVIRLGTAEVRRIVAAGVLGGSFEGLEEAHIDAGDLWRYLITTSLLCEHIAPPALSRPAFTAGMLHDLGRLAMVSTQPEAYAEVVTMVHEGADARYAESEVFGIDHVAWGAQVAEAWKFAPMLIDAIAHHHDGGNPLADTVRQSIRVAEALGLGDGVQLPVEVELDEGSPEAAIIGRFGVEALTDRVDWFREALGVAA